MNSDTARMVCEKPTMARLRGVSSMTISTKSPARRAVPMTRIVRPSRANSVAKASGIERKIGWSRMSMVTSTCGVSSEAASSRRAGPVLRATACAPVLSSNSRTSASGTMPLGAASSTRAAVRPAASRSSSQVLRKLATAGT
jgi:DNA-binding transcriptional regulator YdaS (Cro superfamily)